MSLLSFLDLEGNTMAGVGGAEAPKIASSYNQGMKDYAEAQTAMKKLQEIDRKMSMEDLALQKQKENEPIANALQLQKLNLRPIQPGQERPAMDVNDPNGWLQNVSKDLITDSESDIYKQKAQTEAALSKLDYQNDRVDARKPRTQDPDEKNRAGQVKDLMTSIDKNFKFVTTTASTKKKEALVASIRQLKELGDTTAYRAVYKRFEPILKDSGLPSPTMEKITLKEPVEIQNKDGSRAQILPEQQAPQKQAPPPPPKGAAPTVYQKVRNAKTGVEKTLRFDWDGTKYVRSANQQ